MRMCVCVPDLMWLREANIRSMNEAGTVIVFLVSSSISSFRVITLKEEKKKGERKCVENCEEPEKLTESCCARKRKAFSLKGNLFLVVVET